MIHSNLYNIKYLTQSFQYATEISDIFLMYCVLIMKKQHSKHC